MELFSIDNEIFIAILNSPLNNLKQNENYIEIFKFHNYHRKFIITQKILISSSSIKNIEYFEIEISNEDIHRFLVVTNIQDNQKGNLNLEEFVFFFFQILNFCFFHFLNKNVQ